uniref:TPA-induced transmembrane protein isoform X1 n=1 Tax=Halichoerus grypus TaxID=9711 RepID=UPI001659D61C|nr:TPA-induced transmembrane protein isoform X1 [Halichoerus grypus]
MECQLSSVAPRCRPPPGHSRHPARPSAQLLLWICANWERLSRQRPEQTRKTALLCSTREPTGGAAALPRRGLGRLLNTAPPRPAARGLPRRARGGRSASWSGGHSGLCTLACEHPASRGPLSPPLRVHGRGQIPIAGGRPGALGARGAAGRAEASQWNRPGDPSFGRGTLPSPVTYVDEDADEILELSSNKTFLVVLKVPEECATEEGLPHLLTERLTDVYTSSPSLSRYFTSVEMTDFSDENATIAYHLQFGVPSEGDGFMKYRMSKELVRGVLLQNLHDRGVPGCETLGLGPASLLLYE